MDRPLGAGPPAWPPGGPPGAPPQGAFGGAPPGGYRPPALKMQQPAHQTGLAPSLLAVRARPARALPPCLFSRALLLAQLFAPHDPLPYAAPVKKRPVALPYSGAPRARRLPRGPRLHCGTCSRVRVGTQALVRTSTSLRSLPTLRRRCQRRRKKPRCAPLCVLAHVRGTLADLTCTQEQKALRRQEAAREKGAALLERALPTCASRSGCMACTRNELTLRRLQGTPLPTPKSRATRLRCALISFCAT